MNSQKLERLRAEVLDLPQTERAELAHDLVRSLDGPAELQTEQAWNQEILRRLDEVEAGTASLLDRTEFQRQMKARLSNLG